MTAPSKSLRDRAPVSAPAPAGGDPAATPFYTFDDARGEVVMPRQDMPRPWINYLSNGDLHAFVSQAGGGLAWWKSPTKGRLTRYRAFHMPADGPGFYLYLREADGSIWSPTLLPCETPVDERTARHGAGISVFSARRGDLEVFLTLFVAPDHPVLIWDVRIEHGGARAVELDVFAYCEFSQRHWEKELKGGYYVQHMMKGWSCRGANAVVFLDHDWEPYFDEKPVSFLLGSEPAVSSCADREAFFGPYGAEGQPRAVREGACPDADLSGGHGCGALHHRVRLKRGGTARFHYCLGVIDGARLPRTAIDAALVESARVLRQRTTVKDQRTRLEGWWERHLGAFRCTVPDAVVQRQVNLWSPVNSVHTARYSRGINTWAPGTRGLGFRDTAQDMLAIAYRDPDWAVENLLLLFAHQFEDGHAVHTLFPWDHEPPQLSPRSDNHLWLPLVAHAILAETGDLSLLTREVPYLRADGSPGGPVASVWQHLLAAVEFTEQNLGAHGLPLILVSDWNDLIGKFNRRGRGETTFAGFQYVHALRLLLEMARLIQDHGARPRLEDCLARQEAALEQHAWDGAWWCRGFDDEGVAVGASTGDPSRLFLNPQAWAVIAGVGERSQQLAGMDAVAERLDVGFGLKILDPAFEGWDGDGSREALVGYGPGCGENGAVFCHANTWAVIAEALLGRTERAWQFFNQLVPQNVIDRVGVETYRAEPYAWVSNIVGSGNAKMGWGNVEHISGTATWMDVAATQYLLGVRPELRGLRLDPRLPAGWKSVQLERRYRGCLVKVRVNNRSGAGAGVTAIKVDGESLPPEDIPLVSALYFQGKSKVIVHLTLG